MKKIIILLLTLVFTTFVYAQKPINTKYVTNFPGTSYSINVTSDVQFYSFSGTKTLTSPYTITTTGTPVNGSCITIFYDGSGITSSASNMIVLGIPLYHVTYTDAVSYPNLLTGKYIFLAIYKISTWEVRIFRDAEAINWISPIHVSQYLVNDTSLQYTTTGIRVKPLGISNSHISASAAMDWTKMASLTANMVPITNSSGKIVVSNIDTTKLGYLRGVTSDLQAQITAKTTSGSVVNADVSASAAITYGKLYLTGGVVNADLSSSAAVAWSKMAALTASKAMVTDGSGVGSASSVTATELGYLSGVTSNLQTQIANVALNKITYMSISANTVLTSATMKNFVMIDGTAGGWAITLPLASTITDGTWVEFRLFGTNNGIVKVQGADDIVIDLSGASAFTSADTLKTTHRQLMLFSDGTTHWYTRRNY